MIVIMIPLMVSLLVATVIGGWGIYAFIRTTDWWYRRHNGVPLGDGQYVLRGQLHRLDGPADPSDSPYPTYWSFNGIPYRFDYWCEICRHSDETRVYLKLKYYDLF